MYSDHLPFFFFFLECFVAIDLSSLFSFVISLWSEKQFTSVFCKCSHHSSSVMMLRFPGLSSVLAFCVFEVSAKRPPSMLMFSIYAFVIGCMPWCAGNQRSTSGNCSLHLHSCGYNRALNSSCWACTANALPGPDVSVFVKTALAILTLMFGFLWY